MFWVEMVTSTKFRKKFRTFSNFHPEGKDSMFFRNVDNFYNLYTAVYPEPSTVYMDRREKFKSQIVHLIKRVPYCDLSQK
jgi:hypothetical protein